MSSGEERGARGAGGEHPDCKSRSLARVQLGFGRQAGMEAQTGAMGGTDAARAGRRLRRRERRRRAERKTRAGNADSKRRQFAHSEGGTGDRGNQSEPERERGPPRIKAGALAMPPPWITLPALDKAPSACASWANKSHLHGCAPWQRRQGLHTRHGGS